MYLYSDDPQQESATCFKSILNYSIPLFLFVKQHEEASVQMFDYMLKANNLLPSFIQYNLTERDVVFIKELIAGTALDTTGSQVN